MNENGNILLGLGKYLISELHNFHNYIWEIYTISIINEINTYNHMDIQDIPLGRLGFMVFQKIMCLCYFSIYVIVPVYLISFNYKKSIRVKYFWES